MLARAGTLVTHVYSRLVQAAVINRGNNDTCLFSDSSML